MDSYERVCPVCGERFITKHPQKRFCCAECVAEFNEIKRYLRWRVSRVLEETIFDARNTDKSVKDLTQEFLKKW